MHSDAGRKGKTQLSLGSVITERPGSIPGGCESRSMRAATRAVWDGNTAGYTAGIPRCPPQPNGGETRTASEAIKKYNHGTECSAVCTTAEGFREADVSAGSTASTRRVWKRGTSPRSVPGLREARRARALRHSFTSELPAPSHRAAARR